MWLDKVACFKLNEVGWPLESLKLSKNFLNSNKTKCHGWASLMSEIFLPF